MKYYVAGGAVRDLLLGRTLRDADYLFVGTEKEFIQRNPTARKTQSAPFCIYLLNGQEVTLLPPAQDALPDALRQNLLRRDLTINALLLSKEGVLHAHADAIRDLRDGVLRPASPSSVGDDPVRAFRIARFSASLPDFTVHEESIAQMRDAQSNGLLTAIAAEQVGKECLKACHAEQPGNFLLTLQEGDCLSPWFAELENAHAIPAGPAQYHSRSLLGHTARIMNATAALAAQHAAPIHERALGVWMALCHDLGKISTPPDMLPRHIGHEQRGVLPAMQLGQRLRLPARFIGAGQASSLLHMKGGMYKTLRAGTKVDMLARLHSAGLVRPFSLVAAADSGHEDLPDIMAADLERILDVHLPQQWKNKGVLSGNRLREMRCRALSRG